MQNRERSRYAQVVDYLQNASTYFSEKISHYPIFQKAKSYVLQGANYVNQKAPFIQKTTEVIQQSAPLQNIFIKSAQTYLAYYAAPVIIYKGIVQPVFFDGTSYESESWVASNTVFVGAFSFVLVSSMLYNKSIVRVAQEFVVIDKENPCKEGEVLKARANYSDVVYQGVNVVVGSVPLYLYEIFSSSLVAKIVTPPSWIIYFKYVGNMVLSLAYGNNLISITYINKGQCADHARDVANDNKIIAFSAGSSLLFLSWMLNTLVKKTTGVESFFVSDAISGFLYQFYVLAFLLNDTKLSHKKSLVDVFYLPRKYAAKRIDSRLKSFFEDVHSGKRKINFVIELNNVLSSSFTDYFIQSSAANIFLNLHQKEIKDSLSRLIKQKKIMRISRYDVILNKKLLDLNKWVWETFLKDIMPLPDFLDPNTLELLKKVVKQHGWQETKRLIDTIIDKALSDKDFNEELDIIEIEDKDFKQEYENDVKAGVTNAQKELQTLQSEKDCPGVVTVQTDLIPLSNVLIAKALPVIVTSEKECNLDQFIEEDNSEKKIEAEFETSAVDHAVVMQGEGKLDRLASDNINLQPFLEMKNFFEAPVTPPSDNEWDKLSEESDMNENSGLRKR